jgi:hypothetical protein
MQVIINNEEYSWVSDYDEGWMRSSGDDFKFPVVLGDRHSCFIKRFARDAAEVSGWRFVQALRTNHQPGLARVLDIVQTEERGMPVRYLFCEYMRGTTLDEKINDQSVPHVGRLLGDLLKALRSIHRLGHWMSDFCEKNIFCKDDAYFLIDLDSVHPTAIRPDNLMYGDKTYWSLALSYLSRQAGVEGLRPEDVPGPVLNYLQVALLIVRVRRGLVLNEEEYQSTSLKERLPELLDEAIPEFRGIFAGLVRNEVEQLSEEDIDQIRELLVKRVVNGEKSDRREREKKYDDGRSQARRKPAAQPPVIRRFSTDKKRLRRGGAFTLSWEIDNGDKVVVYRNDVVYQEAANGLGAMTLTERYDGKERTVDYSLEVSNAVGTVRSEPVLSIHIGPSLKIPWKLLLWAAGAVIAATLVVLATVKVIHVWRDRKIVSADSAKRDTTHLKPPPPPVDPLRLYLDSINELRVRKKHRQDSIDRVQDSITKANAAITGKGKKQSKDQKDTKTVSNSGGYVSTKSEADEHTTAKPPGIDSAMVRRVIETNVKNDSIQFVDTVVTRRVSLLSWRRAEELWIHNLSSYRIESVSVLIIPKNGTADEREVHGIPAKGKVLLLQGVPRGGVQTTIRSLTIKLP